MSLEANVPARWVAALLLLVPALLGFQIFLFAVLGGLLMLGVGAAVASLTGYGGVDVWRVALGCALLVFVGGLVAGVHPHAPVLGYAVAASIAIRPNGRYAIASRVAAVLLLLLVASVQHVGELQRAGQPHMWWLLFFVSPVVAGADALAERMDSQQEAAVAIPQSPTLPVTPNPVRKRVDFVLVAASVLTVVLLPWILTYAGRSGLALVVLGLFAALVPAMRAVRALREDPVRSLGTVALSVFPILVLAPLALFLLYLALGGSFQLGG